MSGLWMGAWEYLSEQTNQVGRSASPTPPALLLDDEIMGKIMGITPLCTLPHLKWEATYTPLPRHQEPWGRCDEHELDRILIVSFFFCFLSLFFNFWKFLKLHELTEGRNPLPPGRCHHTFDIIGTRYLLKCKQLVHIRFRHSRNPCAFIYELTQKHFTEFLLYTKCSLHEILHI